MAANVQIRVGVATIVDPTRCHRDGGQEHGESNDSHPKGLVPDLKWVSMFYDRCAAKATVTRGRVGLLPTRGTRRDESGSSSACAGSLISDGDPKKKHQTKSCFRYVGQVSKKTKQNARRGNGNDPPPSTSTCRWLPRSETKSAHVSRYVKKRLVEVVNMHIQCLLKKGIRAYRTVGQAHGETLMGLHRFPSHLPFCSSFWA